MALALGVTLAMVGVSPTLAWPSANEPGSYGAQPQCNYLPYAVGSTHGWRLHRMIVQPPTRLVADYAGQVVGWRFVVQKIDAMKSDTDWQRVFASRIEKAPSSLYQAPVFEPMNARIRWIGDLSTYPYPLMYYRTIVKFYWYASDGSVSRTERWTPYQYNHIIAGNLIYQYWVCGEYDNFYYPW